MTFANAYIIVATLSIFGAFFSVHSRSGLVPVAVQFSIPGIWFARGALGHCRFGAVRVRRTLGLGRRARVDRDRLLHRLRRLRQFRALLSTAPAAQPPHVLRLPRPSSHHGHDQLPNGRSAASAQSNHGKFPIGTQR